MLSAGQAVAGCTYDRIQLKTVNNNIVGFSIEVASTNKTRAKGLMHRDFMPEYSGMLFVYNAPQNVSFWMRNTLIPLDMIFADETGTVVKVHHNAKPLDETPIFGGNAIFAILELNGGMAEKMKIAPGSMMQHQSFSHETAAWPCKN